MSERPWPTWRYLVHIFGIYVASMVISAALFLFAVGVYVFFMG